MISIRRIELPVPGIERLQSEAMDEGYNFIETLVAEWANASNRFDAPGEALCGHLDQGMLAAVGGLNCDPFAGRPDMGRIRRVYVRAGWRNRGVGRALMTALVDEARNHFTCVRLRAENEGAARLYESMGFVPIASPDATHILLFEPVIVPT
ncbi:MAG TPA: GNAT family N-acetyltransferase [Acidobacteriaceae bacterium]|nr:GNAT family N-acetyltransferase [Acidobacteriaceae bacterium]